VPAVPLAPVSREGGCGAASVARVPEMLEVEAYRALAQRAALHRPIAAVEAPDAWYLKRGLDASALQALVGCELVAARRTGKLLLLGTMGPDGADGPVLGLRFGMSGRLVVDGAAGVAELRHSSNRALEAYDRFGLRFTDGGHLRVRDPRRLGGVELDPIEAALGPDAADVSLAKLTRALAASKAPLKARLMDQARLAGVGNLIADEVLWRAGLAPGRPAGSLSPAELRRLHRHLKATVAQLGSRGGSHTGDLMAQRQVGGVCPKDGRPLERATVGGRTTFWCRWHQH
jgi:formamidopyrimidine-DNA glycosylase